MMYGIIEYDINGNPLCEICRGAFKRVLTHVRQSHGMTEREYKIQFGFDLGRGICSKESSELSRTRVYENFDKCVDKNLISKGNKTRFKNRHVGRGKEMVSAQTKIRLKERLKEPYMVAAMKKSGLRVAKSGLGNLKRWANKK